MVMLIDSLCIVHDYKADRRPFKVGMDRQVDVFIPPGIVWMLWNLPNGTYGISYDIFSRKTEDNLPHGWNAPRGEFRNSNSPAS